MTDAMPTRGDDGALLSEADRMRMSLDDGKLHCRRCQAALKGPVVFRDGHPNLRCACGLWTRIMRTPHAPEPRQRPKGTKKERRRARRAAAISDTRGAK